MIDDALELAQDAMKGAQERLAKELSRIRTGRANPALLDDIRVDSYGSKVPLNQVSTVTVGDARLLVIKPWDRNLVSEVERAINNASLGLNSSSDGVIVRVPIPPLTEERRKQLVKQAKEAGEDARIAIRQARRDANDVLKSAQKDSDLSEDELKDGLARVQSVTDDHIKQVDETIKKKEVEILGD
ncbi:MAG: ribosome recycling factor [Myxococcales bacterium FL481]|nr:MAG: ribosome recycling factor [Myxococcales bacterium FL481]